MTDGVSRRQFLKITSFSAAALAFGWGLEACDDGEDELRFFSPDERATVEAAAARILPSDDGPGAREAGAVRYLETLLSAFDHSPPLIFAGGPFSGRQPYPDNDTGRPSKDRPDNAFRDFMPLSRVKDLAWRVRLFGSANVAGGDFNDEALGPTKGWRERYREGVASLDAKSRELFSRAFVDATPDDQDRVLAEADPEFVSLLVEHTVEGMYSAPEYGGNRDLAGWLTVRFEGDSQPLGYSVFDRSSDGYKELAEHPVSAQNPDEDFRGLDDETLEFVDGIVTLVRGKRFF